MKAHLMTRGTPRRMDYAFLGETPSDRWWEQIADGGWLMQDYPELAVAGHGGHADIMVSGIPSARRDVIGTAIRYTLVLSGAHEDPDVAQRLVAALLCPGGHASLGASLDEVFDATTVDALMKGDAVDLDIPGRLDELLREWAPELDGEPGQDESASWVGVLDDPGAVDAFAARTRELLDGSTGMAFTSHSLASAAGAERAFDGLDRQVAILLVNSSDVDEVRPLGKELAPASTGHRSPGVPATGLRRLLPILAVGTGIGLLILIVVWWWARRH